MSFSAKWLGEDEIFYEECRNSKDKVLIEKLVYLLNEADVVVAHNGDKFDLPKIKGRALVHGIDPPSPYRTVDTVKVARKNFGFSSNSLEYLSDVLDLKVKKKNHKKFPGWELWLECLKGNEEAWKEMREYNIDDVIALEEIYLKMLPYINNHPNVSIKNNNNNDDERVHCSKCSSDDITWQGYAYTNVGKYHRYKCNSCGGWSQTRYTLLPTNRAMLKSI